MSRPLNPRPAADDPSPPPLPHSSSRTKKISTACGACKARKTRCSGGFPCDACATRTSQCRYDAASDQRRKVANQRNLHELENIQRDLGRHRELLGGIIATVRAGDEQANHELTQLIRSGIGLSQLAAHVRNELRSNLRIQHAYEAINFVINGPEGLPSPRQILNESRPASHLTRPLEQSMIMYTQDTELDLLPAEDADHHFFGVDPTP